MNTLKLYAGFDGGGSNTRCVLCDENGKILGTGKGGANNFRYCGEETAKQSMRDALNGAFETAGIEKQPLQVAYVSSATIPTFGGAEYLPFFKACVDSNKLICEGDLYPIWYGGARENPAAVLIAGTGSAAYIFRNDGESKRFIRSGGWGPHFSDEGSGYDIGVSAIRLLMKMYDGRAGTDSEFYDAILKHFEISDPRKFIGISLKPDFRKRAASCARAVCELAQSGNETANHLADGAVNELYELIKAVLKRDGGADKLPLIVYGGLMSEKSLIYARLRKIALNLNRIVDVRPLRAGSASVCAALALKSDGLTESSERLMAYAEEAGEC